MQTRSVRVSENPMLEGRKKRQDHAAKVSYRRLKKKMATLGLGQTTCLL